MGRTLGNWAIDEKALRNGLEWYGRILLVVAIDMRKEKGVLEFSPFKETNGKRGRKEILKVFSGTLKPNIDKIIDVKKKENLRSWWKFYGRTLLVIYAGLRYPSIFGKLMIFSPSLWIYAKKFILML